jgi:hypothetical protein
MLPLPRASCCTRLMVCRLLDRFAMTMACYCGMLPSWPPSSEPAEVAVALTAAALWSSCVSYWTPDSLASRSTNRASLEAEPGGIAILGRTRFQVCTSVVADFGLHGGRGARERGGGEAVSRPVRRVARFFSLQCHRNERASEPNRQKRRWEVAPVTCLQRWPRNYAIDEDPIFI